MSMGPIDNDKPKRVGCIPFYFDGTNLKMLFMVPSDPEYGGDLPQIAKGQIDRSEAEQDAAIREATEELGLVKENILSTERLYNGSPFPVYGVHIQDQNNFSTPHYETGQTMWLSPDKFDSIGREFQKFMVRSVVNSILSRKRRGQYEK
jgi:8-oxo-dGTP pyrophosphatase MutT (NUDIX family)